MREFGGALAMLQGGTPEVEATFRGSLIIMGMKGR
jgi:hypothetical protein